MRETCVCVRLVCVRLAYVGRVCVGRVRVGRVRDLCETCARLVCESCLVHVEGEKANRSRRLGRNIGSRNIGGRNIGGRNIGGRNIGGRSLRRRSGVSVLGQVKAMRGRRMREETAHLEPVRLCLSACKAQQRSTNR